MVCQHHQQRFGGHANTSFWISSSSLLCSLRVVLDNILLQRSSSSQQPVAAAVTWLLSAVQMAVCCVHRQLPICQTRSVAPALQPAELCLLQPNLTSDISCFMCPAGVPVVLTEQQAAAALQQFALHYDAAAGQRLLGLLSHRAARTPIAVDSSARALGRHFPLLGYRPVIKALVEVLLAMENNLELKTSDDYERAQHILQLAGPPGLGKTTAATALWAALHYACCCNSSSSSSSSSSSCHGLFPVTPVWQKMHQRILASLSPSKLLVFFLDFADGEWSVA